MIRLPSALALASVLALGLVLGSTGGVAAEPHKAGEIVMTTGTIKTAEGETIAYELGTLYVPENRAAPRSRSIGIGFARIKAARPTGAPPIFILPGGPGVSYLDSFSSGVPDHWLTHVLPYRPAGDIVVVDQRGFSKRGDVLQLPARPQPLDQPRTPAAAAANQVTLAKQAIAAHADKDLAGYTIVECAADVNDLRKALGYRQITLSGQSFGSQWAFAVMRLHPEIVARALLSGVEPLANGYDLPSHILAALQRIAWDADRDPGLAPYLPAGGVMAAMRAVRDRLARGPIKVTINATPAGKPQTVTLGLADFQTSLLRSASGLPAFVLSLYHRRYEEWAREVIEARQDAEPISLISALIDTSVGVSAEREHLLRTDPGIDAFGDHDFASRLASAQTWPTPDVGDALRAPVQSQIPVLFIHGDWDIAAPIENTFGILPYFPNGRAVLVHRGGHHSRAPVFAQHPDILKQVNAFLVTGDTRAIPIDITLPAPTFQRPSFPPPRP